MIDSWVSKLCLGLRVCEHRPFIGCSLHALHFGHQVLQITNNSTPMQHFQHYSTRRVKLNAIHSEAHIQATQDIEVGTCAMKPEKQEAIEEA